MVSKHRLMVLLLIALSLFLFQNFKTTPKKEAATSAAGMDTSAIHFANEKHLKNVKQLTFGGENAEAYWSFNNKYLSFQGKNNKTGLMCDQIFVLDVASDTKMPISKGGRTT